MGKDKEKKSDRIAAKILGAYAGGNVSSSLFPGLISQKLLSPLIDRGIEPYATVMVGRPEQFKIDPETAARAEKIRKAIGAPKVPIERGPQHFSISPQISNITNWLHKKVPWYVPFGETTPVILARSPNIPAIAHEIGHTVKSPIAPIGVIPSKSLRPLGIIGGLAAALSENEDLQKWAPAIGASGTLPLLLEEGRASGHALRGIAKTEGTKEALKALKVLAPGFGSYALSTATAALAPVIAKLLSDKFRENFKKAREEEKKRKRKGQKKEAAQKPIPLKTEGRLKASPSRAWATEGPKPKTSKPGKATSTKINLPSKRKFYRDIQRQMDPKRGQRLAVKEASIEGVLAGAATMAGTNLIAHILLNTKVSTEFVRKFAKNLGDEYLKAGFRHGVFGKKVSSFSPAGMVPGAIVGPAPMMMYNQGHKYGDRIHKILQKIPALKEKQTVPFKAFMSAGSAAGKAMKAAPYGGLAGGAAKGYAVGDGDGMPIKEMAIGAALGGFAGKGAQHILPKLPPVKQLRWVRDTVVKPTLEGSNTRIGKILDKMAK